MPGLAPLTTPFHPQEKELTNTLSHSLDFKAGRAKLVEFLEEILGQRLANVYF